MTPILARACPRCRGALAPDDDGYVCINCARPLTPALEPLPLVMGHGELRYSKWPTGYEWRLAEGRRPHRRRS